MAVVLCGYPMQIIRINNIKYILYKERDGDERGMVAVRREMKGRELVSVSKDIIQKRFMLDFF